MADFTLTKPLISGKKGIPSRRGNIGYALFVLFCFWVGAQVLTAVVHAPAVWEHLMPLPDPGRPHIEMGLAVGTLFGLIPFLAGCAVVGIVAFVIRIRRYF
ncbi:DUF2755 family protein [Enterobacteriaceae bacterium RIT691]|nr:DUF2755 family protein [Enterobacteriaceae bacterium RIT691]